MNLPSGYSPSRSPCLWNPLLLVISDQWLVVSEICLLVFGFCLPIPNWRRRRPPLCPCASVPLCHLALARSACATRHWALEFNAVGVEGAGGAFYPCLSVLSAVPCGAFRAKHGGFLYPYLCVLCALCESPLSSPSLCSLCPLWLTLLPLFYIRLGVSPGFSTWGHVKNQGTDPDWVEYPMLGRC